MTKRTTITAEHAEHAEFGFSKKVSACFAYSAVIVVALGTLLGAQQPPTVTPQDKTEIQSLVSAYAKALRTCAAADFADLFAPDGYFASGFRGYVAGRSRLIALVESERQCFAPPSTSVPRPSPGNGPTVVVDVTPTGVVGIADLGAAGRYEDEYVKTPKGWRFAARTVISKVEQVAGLNAREMAAIRRLASGPQDVDEFWAAGEDGVKRFRSAGVVIGVSAPASDGVITGRVYLKDGGHYDDVYEKIAAGQWRFKTRVYVTEASTK